MHFKLYFMFDVHCPEPDLGKGSKEIETSKQVLEGVVVVISFREILCILWEIYDSFPQCFCLIKIVFISSYWTMQLPIFSFKAKRKLGERGDADTNQENNRGKMIYSFYPHYCTEQILFIYLDISLLPLQSPAQIVLQLKQQHKKDQVISPTQSVVVPQHSLTTSRTS